MKIFIISVLVIVGISIGVSLYVVGSPQKARLARFDEMRVQNLQFIQNELLSYWIDKNTLPDQLSELNDDLLQVRVPLDPQNERPYTYEKKGDETFVLCADFSLDSSDRASSTRGLAYSSYYSNAPLMGEQTWGHTAGTNCFERTIDKDRYQSDLQTQKNQLR
jgi:hypothetical protein